MAKMLVLPLFEPMHPGRKAFDIARLMAVLWEGFVTPASVAGQVASLYLSSAWTDLIFLLKIPVDCNTRAYTRFGARTETLSEVIAFRVGPQLWLDIIAAVPYHTLAWALASNTETINDGLDISMAVHALGLFRIVYLFQVIERLWSLFHIDSSKLRPTEQIPCRQYLSVLYFTSSTFFPIGYGDISMRTVDTRFYVILLMALGVVSFLLWTVAIARSNLEERLRDNPVSGRTWAIRQYLNARECGPKLEQSIQDWFLFQVRNAEREYSRLEYDELPPSYRAVIAEQLARLTMPDDSVLFYDLLRTVETVVPSSHFALYKTAAIDNRYYIVSCGEVLCYNWESGVIERNGPGFTFGGSLITNLKSVCEIVCCPGCELLVLDLLSVQRIVNASGPFRPALRDAVKRNRLWMPDKAVISQGDPFDGSAVLAIADCLSARECRAVLRTTESRRLRLQLYQTFCAALAEVLESYDGLQCDLQEILLET